MNDLKVARILVPVAVTAIFGPSVYAATDPITSEEYEVAGSMQYSAICDDRMEPLREPDVLVAIDRTNAAIAAGDLAAAEAAWWQFYKTAHRGAAGDRLVRCLSEGTLQRYLDMRTDLWRLGSSLDTEGRSKDYTAIYIAAVDRGTPGVVEGVKALPADQFKAAYRSVYRISQYAEGVDAGGWPRTAQERTLGRACEAALAPLRQHAGQAYDAALADEPEAFKRPATQSDRDLAEQLRAGGSMASGMLGVELIDDQYLETVISERQSRDSLALLQQAQHFEFGQFDQDKPSPTMRRARERGEVRLTQADATSLNLKRRDSLYGQAIKYFDWCDCEGRRAAAKTAQEQIQPALEEAETQRSEAIAKKAEQMMKDIDPEAIKKSVEDMQKSDAEKKSFQDEADALEAELGF